MKFKRGQDIKEVLKIGLLQACIDLTKDLRINILNEEETRDLIFFESEHVWKFYPRPHTAADFMTTDALTKSAGCAICISTMNNRFFVSKNIDKILDQPLAIGNTGTLAELYDILKNEIQ